MVQCWLKPGALLSPPHLLYFRSLAIISPVKWVITAPPLLVTGGGSAWLVVVLLVKVQQAARSS